MFPGKNRAVKVNFEGIFLDPEGVLEQYANYDPEQYKALQKSRYGCNQPEDIETVMVLVAVDGQNYLMGMDMLQYNEKWYVGSIMGSSGMHVIGLRERESVLIPLEDLDIDLSRVKMYSVEKGEHGTKIEFKFQNFKKYVKQYILFLYFIIILNVFVILI